MQMLQAGGIPILSDGVRGADADNPRGYLELERVKQIKSDKAWLDDAEGKAVKIIHMLLMDLPCDREYRVIFMRRDIDQVIRSQAVMLDRGGKQGGTLRSDRLQAIFQAQLSQVDAWLAGHTRFRVLNLEHALALKSPRQCAREVAAFLQLPLDEEAMAAAVDPALHRHRSA